MTILFVCMYMCLLLTEESVNGKLQYFNKKRRWEGAVTECKENNGLLATRQDLNNRTELQGLNVTDNVVWIDSYDTTSQWIEHFNCFKFNETATYANITVQNPKSANCLLHCKNDSFVGLMNNTCFCLGNNTTHLEDAFIWECLNNCSQSQRTLDYCGGENRISVYKTVNIDSISYSDIDSISLCMGVNCAPTRTDPPIYFPYNCSEKLSNVCDQSRNDVNLTWTEGLINCVNTTGSFPTGARSKQWFCAQTSKVKRAWTSIFRQLISTSTQSGPLENVLYCKTLNLLENKTITTECSATRSFICIINEDEKGTSTKYDGSNISITSDSSSEVTSMSLLTSVPSSGDINTKKDPLVSDINMELIIAVCVVALVVIVVIVVAVICFKQRKKDKAAKISKEIIKDRSNVQDAADECQAMTAPQRVSEQEDEADYATLASENPELNEGEYNITGECDYDHLNEKEKRRIRSATEENTYDETGDFKENVEDENTYDTANNQQKVISTNDTYYDHTVITKPPTNDSNLSETK